MGSFWSHLSAQMTQLIGLRSPLTIHAPAPPPPTPPPPSANQPGSHDTKGFPCSPHLTAQSRVSAYSGIQPRSNRLEGCATDQRARILTPKVQVDPWEVRWPIIRRANFYPSPTPKPALKST